ncbi:hypothetical protein NDU88_004215 [Pleurodeles waltl]|uniref:Uncharacterized protein n=1 Tax=Pleurodeles waltl TaxID=8319 RepID=A0AAV7VHK9_PLEWA|nr:hypothetical protein NDU88_004215 [Pleurodeles waltl]
MSINGGALEATGVVRCGAEQAIREHELPTHEGPWPSPGPGARVYKVRGRSASRAPLKLELWNTGGCDSTTFVIQEIGFGKPREKQERGSMSLGSVEYEDDHHHGSTLRGSRTIAPLGEKNTLSV